MMEVLRGVECGCVMAASTGWRPARQLEAAEVGPTPATQLLTAARVDTGAGTRHLPVTSGLEFSGEL